ncbi:MAG: UvrD-helicase domain-containing protein [Clostridia bacterium]|nr:UvrD-helicase domain-containing protein [Clostridia bacterium]
MAFNPTKEQKNAINANGSLLVSAAAGSGKTAVLVERVVRLLTNPENPISADKILVVTYTNAAAAELRGRIEKKLNEVIETSGYSPLLSRQKILLSNAKICTIDSFCLDFIRENYEASGLNPSFKIAEASVLNSLTNTAINKVFEEYYNSGDKEFLELLEFVGSDYDDSALISFILKIFNFSRQMPFPNEWIKSVAKDYELHSKGKSTKWLDDASLLVKEMVDEALIYIDKASKILSLYEVAYSKYSANFNYIYDYFLEMKEFCEEKSWDKIYNKSLSFAPPKCASLSKEYKTAEVEYSTALRDKATKLAKEIKSIVYTDTSGLIEEFGFCSRFIEKIVELVCRFEDELYKLLNEKNLITFYIAEQTTLSMIAEYKDGKILPRADAKEFINHYEAVFADEYQDTNNLQDCLFAILSDNERKLFSVGDAKQCIYRFRGSNPYNFIEKKAKYVDFEGATEQQSRRIELGCNFRSRKEICQYVNAFFSKTMNKQNSDIDYKGHEELVPKAIYEETNEPKVETYLLDANSIISNGFVFDGDDDKLFRLTAEATAIADIIEDLIKKEPFLKGENGLRKAEYKDITILSRSMDYYGEVLVNVLKSRNIPVSIQAGDLLKTEEAVLLISMLKVINNPSDDIALLNVLTSPIFAFSMEELAQMRIEGRKGKFISAVSVAAIKGNEKAKGILNVLSTFRRKSVVLSLSNLIEEIFDSTGLLSIVSEFDNGSAKVDNLLVIQNFAATFESERKKSLGEFLSAVENLSGKDFKISSGNSSNCVTVMSIHGSKGLQFPICILYNIAKQFNFLDFNSPMLIDEKYGFSFSYFDKEEREKNKTLLRFVMDNFDKRQQKAEELRLLYVAMTRAEEKLIMTACYKDLAKSISSKISSLYDSDNLDSIEYSLFKKSMSYGDWLLYSELISQNGKALYDYVGIDKDITKEDNYSNTIKIIERLENIAIDENIKPEISEEAVKELKLAYNYKYPFEALLALEAKASVTDIVHKSDEKTYQFKSRPAFMSKDGLSGAEKGTATHKFMQYCDFDKAKADINSEKDRLYEWGFLTEREAEAVDLELVNVFLNSDLFSRVKGSGMVKKEMKFLTEFDATDLKPELDKFFKCEKIVVQGAVDLLFEENGKLVIVDFKTDRNKNEEELKAAYKEQLEIYGKACSSLLGLPVGELNIYSFALKRAIKI